MSRNIRHLDLFSGIGGFALAARRVGWDTVGFCEIDPYCQKVLNKNFPGTPIAEDIHNYDGQECDIITAGFPCQPYSTSGLQLGSSDDRALWPEIIRILNIQRPTWFIGENVIGFTRLGLEQAVSDLESIGYSVRTFDIPATGKNALHARRRLWIVAHSERNEQSREEPRSWPTRRMGREREPVSWDTSWEDAVAYAGGVDDGVSGRVVTDRTDSIRNAIVPQIAEEIYRAIGATYD